MTYKAHMHQIRIPGREINQIVIGSDNKIVILAIDPKLLAREAVYIAAEIATRECSPYTDRYYALRRSITAAIWEYQDQAR